MACVVDQQDSETVAAPKPFLARQLADIPSCMHNGEREREMVNSWEMARGIGVHAACSSDGLGKKALARAATGLGE